MPASRVLVISLAAAVLVVSEASLPPSETESRRPCWGRVATCSLHCLWSQKLCRLCCQGGAGWVPDAPTEPPTSSSEETEEPGDDGEVTFPDSLPEGTEDAMLETAAHILAIVAAEEPERVRVWLERPERNLDHLDELAGKLAAIPRAPFGRAYWKLVLRSARERPFTLLRDALAIRTVHQSSGIPGIPITAEPLN